MAERVARRSSGEAATLSPMTVAIQRPTVEVVFKLLPPFGPDVAKRVPAADHVATPGGWEPGPQDYKACCQLLCDAFDSRNSFQLRSFVYRGRSVKDGSCLTNDSSHASCITGGLWHGNELVSAAVFRVNVPPLDGVPATKHVQIMFLATGTRHRGCGFARLLTSCIMWAASRAEHQYVTVTLLNKTVEAFWGKLGFAACIGTAAAPQDPKEASLVSSILRMSQQHAGRSAAWVARTAERKAATCRAARAAAAAVRVVLYATAAAAAAAGGEASTAGVVKVEEAAVCAGGEEGGSEGRAGTGRLGMCPAGTLLRQPSGQKSGGESGSSGASGAGGQIVVDPRPAFATVLTAAARLRCASEGPGSCSFMLVQQHQQQQQQQAHRCRADAPSGVASPTATPQPRDCKGPAAARYDERSPDKSARRLAGPWRRKRCREDQEPAEEGRETARQALDGGGHAVDAATQWEPVGCTAVGHVEEQVLGLAAERDVLRQQQQHGEQQQQQKHGEQLAVAGRLQEQVCSLVEERGAWKKERGMQQAAAGQLQQAAAGQLQQATAGQLQQAAAGQLQQVMARQLLERARCLLAERGALWQRHGEQPAATGQLQEQVRRLVVERDAASERLIKQQEQHKALVGLLQTNYRKVVAERDAMAKRLEVQEQQQEAAMEGLKDEIRGLVEQRDALERKLREQGQQLAAAMVVAEAQMKLAMQLAAEREEKAGVARKLEQSLREAALLAGGLGVVGATSQAAGQGDGVGSSRAHADHAQLEGAGLGMNRGTDADATAAAAAAAPGAAADDRAGRAAECARAAGA